MKKTNGRLQALSCLTGAPESKKLGVSHEEEHGIKSLQSTAPLPQAR